MKTIWVAGAKGQLGTEINLQQSKLNENKFLFTDIEELDLTKETDVLDYAREKQVKYIVNCAAYTAVDKAETDQENAHLINCKVPEILTRTAHEIDAILIQVSTDYVFDGKKDSPYEEADQTNPQSVYGKTKLCGELAVLKQPGNLVIRTSWLYSAHGNNFVKTMLRLGNERDELGVVADQHGSPTSAADLADVILRIIDKLEKKVDFTGGIYHYANDGVCSWANFAGEIMRQAKLDCKINSIPSADYPTPAQRPMYSVMNTSKIKADFGIEIPHWKESLERVIDQLLP